MSSEGAQAAEEARPARRVTLVRVIALLITAVSILSAIAAWRASVVSGDAGSLDQRATEERVRKQQIEGELDAVVEQDQRLFPRYLTHLRSYQTLTKRAKEKQGEDALLAGDLRRDAAEELALTRLLYQELYFKPVFGDDVYDEEGARAYLRSTETDLASLDPDKALDLAQEERDRGTTLVGVTALFIGALFFLTLAQVGRRMARRGFALAGLLLMVGASVAFVVVGL